MKKCIFIPLLMMSLGAQASNDLSLEFIGEAIFPTGFTFEGTEVGGLSGIDYDRKNNTYITISDDRAENNFARFYDLEINLDDGYLDDGDVVFTKVTEIVDVDNSSFEAGSVDPESIRLSSFPDLLYWTSEGNAENGIAPFVRIMSRAGKPIDEFQLPEKFLPNVESGVRNNLAFENLTFSFNNKHIFTATENALVQDGPEAALNNGSDVRVLRLNISTGKPNREFIYKVDPVSAQPIPEGAFSTNGLVELLTIAPQTMIAIERSFSVGVGNSIRLYLTSTRGASNVRRINAIENVRYIRPMRKQLLLDLAAIGIPLDNIEGVTFGPRLPTGERTLILVSDNNFNANGQFTQFLAFKLSAY